MKYNFNMKITIDLKSKIILEFTFFNVFSLNESFEFKKMNLLFQSRCVY